MSADQPLPTIDVLGPPAAPAGRLRIPDPVSGVVALAGELDIDTALLLEEHLAQLAGSIRLNTTAVTFIDFSGVRALLDLHRRCEEDGSTFRIEACSPSVEEVLQRLGLYNLLTEDVAGYR